jgi:hypothetical protein
MIQTMKRCNITRMLNLKTLLWSLLKRILKKNRKELKLKKKNNKSMK